MNADTHPFAVSGVLPWLSRPSAFHSGYRGVEIHPSSGQIRLKMHLLAVQAEWHPYVAFCQLPSSIVRLIPSQHCKGPSCRVCILWGQVNVIFGHVNSTQNAHAHMLKFRKRVQNFLTILGVLFSYIEVGSPVGFWLVIIDTFDLFVLFHLVISRLFFS